MLKEKINQKKNWTKTKNEGFFCLFFLCFEVKREKDSNSFKNNGKYNGFFRAHIVFSKKKTNKRTETEYKRQFTIISIKKTTFFILGYIKKRTIKKRNRVYKKNQKMRVKQNEKPFFKRQKNKTWKNTEV